MSPQHTSKPYTGIIISGTVISIRLLWLANAISVYLASHLILIKMNVYIESKYAILKVCCQPSMRTDAMLLNTDDVSLTAIDC